MKLSKLLIMGLAIGLLALSGWKAFSHFMPSPPGPLSRGAGEGMRGKWVCPMRCLGKVYDHPGKCPVCHMELKAVEEHANKVLGYTCPLHYSAKLFDQGGRCPFCSLQLKPVYAEAAPALGAQVFEPWPKVDGRTAIAFRPYTVAKVQIDRILRVSGRLSRGGRHFVAKLPLGEAAALPGASAMLMPPLGYMRPVFAVVVAGPAGTVTVETSRPLPGFDFANAEIRIAGPLAMAVPLEAVDETGKLPAVYVRAGAGYEPRTIQLGQKGESFYEIKSGLKIGDEVAGSGVFWLASQWRMDHPGQAL